MESFKMNLAVSNALNQIILSAFLRYNGLLQQYCESIENATILRKKETLDKTGKIKGNCATCVCKFSNF